MKVPFVKSTARADLAVVSDSEKSLLREMDKEVKKEEQGKRDRW